MRSLRKIIVWQSLTSHEDKLKVYCYVCHFKFSQGRKDLANKTHKKYEDKTFREEKDIPQKILLFPSPHWRARVLLTCHLVAVGAI